MEDKRLNVSVYVSNIFNYYQKYSNETVTDTFCSWSESKMPRSSYGLSISWRFGELKAQVKRTARSINNDDVKSGGNSSSSEGSSSSGTN